jgi:hypothetical protein
MSPARWESAQRDLATFYFKNTHFVNWHLERLGFKVSSQVGRHLNPFPPMQRLGVEITVLASEVVLIRLIQLSLLIIV